MLDNPDKQPIDCEATIVSDESSPFENQNGVPSLEERPSQARSLLKDVPSSADVLALINKFLARAVEKKASHIEIKPEENFLSIRYSHQGDLLKPLIDPLPQQFITPIISNLKSMAELDINTHSTPQKGRIRKRGGGRTIHFCVQTQPSFYGEQLMIRVLDSAVQPLSLAQLVPEEGIRQSLEQISRQSSGLLLMTSSDPHMLSPLRYGLLSQETLNKQKIATVEASISYILPGITQIEVNPDKDQDYPDVLKSLLTQDKQQIIVDRLPNPSVARTVVEMASNDYLMIASFEASDAISAVTRLSQMVTPELLANSLIGVVHQHKIRRLCPTCRTVHEPSSQELEQYGIPQVKATQKTFYQARCLDEREIEEARQKGRLCRQCDGKGYDGEINVYELLQGTQALKQAIAQQANPEQLKQAASQSETSSPLTLALEFVYQGQTTLAELGRLFPESLQASQTMTGVSSNLTERLDKVEELLGMLTKEFGELKQSLNPTSPSANTVSPTIPPLSANTDEAFKETYVSEELPQPTDFFKETIATPPSVYEELTDPGEWEELKRELDPSKETIAVDFYPEEESHQNNPFKSLSDPWS